MSGSRRIFIPFEKIDRAHENHLTALDIFPRSTPRVRSVALFLKHVYKLHTDLNKIQGDSSPLRFYFRGQPGPYPLLPKLLRPTVAKRLLDAHKKAFGDPDIDLSSVQRNMIFRLARYAEQFHPSSSSLSDVGDFLSWMCLAQHHELPTFLLDWAVNPLASLFFACDNTSGQDKSLNGVVWCLELKTKLERSERSILHLEKTPFHLDTQHHEEVEEIANICRTAQIVDTKPKILVPRMLTRRIENQAGRFLACSQAVRVNYIDTAPHDIAWKRIFPLVIIPKESKSLILDELRTLRVHKGSMYADLDNYAKFLADGYL